MNKHVEEDNYDEKIGNLNDRLQRASEQVTTLKKEQAQQVALRQEMRKVKLEEIESIKARQKRVELNKKQQIIEKEKAQESLVKTMKSNEAQMAQRKYENQIRAMIERERLYNSLNQYVSQRKMSPHLVDYASSTKIPLQDVTVPSSPAKMIGNNGTAISAKHVRSLSVV